MTKPNFTPGPWSTTPCSSRVFGFRDEPSEPVAWIDDEHKEYKANAHLIAAAPDMYNELEQVQFRLAEAAELAEEGSEQQFVFRKQAQSVAAALSKARGEG